MNRRTTNYYGVMLVILGLLIVQMPLGHSISTARADEVILEDFDDLSGWDISGDFTFTFEPSKSEVKEGKFSGKLEYDVPRKWSRIIIKPKETLKFSGKLEEISFWLYATGTHYDLKMFFMFADSSGEKHTYYFSPYHETKFTWIESRCVIEPLKGKSGGSGSEIKGGDGNKELDAPWTLEQISIAFREKRKDVIYFDKLVLKGEGLTLTREAKKAETEAPEEDLIENGSFEKIASYGAPEGWEIDFHGGSGGKIEVVEGHGGKGKAVRIDMRKGTKPWGCLKREIRGIVPNSQYLLKAKVKTSKSYPQIVIFGDHYIAQAKRKPGQWVEFSKKLNSAKQSGTAQIWLLNETKDSVMEFADVQLIGPKGEIKEEKAKLKPVIDESKIPGPSQPAEPGNRVANMGFEKGVGPGGLPEGWHGRSWEDAGSQVKVSLDEKIRHSGSRSVKLYSDDKAGMGGINQKVKVTPNRIYYFIAWVKTENMETRTTEAVTAGIDIGGKKTFINMGKRGKDVSTDWRMYFSRVEVPAGVEEIELSLILYKAKGTAWLDDIWFGDRAMGWKKLEGSLYVQAKGNLAVGEKELGRILSRKGKKDKRYDELSKASRAKIAGKVKLPPLKEIDTPMSVTGPLSPWSGVYKQRPNPCAIGTGGMKPLRVKIKRGQTSVQASTKPFTTVAGYCIVAELQGKPGPDTKVKNVTTEEEYVYTPDPNKRTEYAVDMKTGKFTFGKPQREGDEIELCFTYWRYTYIDPEKKLNDEELLDLLMDDAADLYCRTVRISLANWTWDNLMKYMDELEERGMRVGDMHVDIENSKGNIFGKQYDKVPVSAVIPYVKKLRGRVDQYIIWYGPREGGGPALPPAEYVKGFRPLAKAFREADPDAKIIAPLIDSFSVGTIKVLFDAGLDALVDGVALDIYNEMTSHGYPELPTGKLEYRTRKEVSGFDFSGIYEPMLYNYFAPMDIHGFEKEVKCVRDVLEKYKKGIWIDNCEWGFDFGYPGCWAFKELPWFPVAPPEPTADRKQYAEALNMPDIPSRQGRYNNGIMTARQAIIWSDLYTELGLNGISEYQGMHETWHYGLSLLSQWGKRRLKYYAYQTVNKLLYSPKKLERPKHLNTLPKDMHSHVYLRDNDELVIILWTPLRQATVDVVIDNKEFAYPVNIDLFDYDNLMPLDSEVVGKQRVIRNVPVSPEPFIIRLVKM